MRERREGRYCGLGIQFRTTDSDVVATGVFEEITASEGHASRRLTLGIFRGCARLDD
jgi:hypothetical protein